MNMPTYQNARGSILVLHAQWRQTVAAVIVLLLTAGFGAFSQTSDDPNDFRNFAKPDATNNPANGSGMLIAGELWDSFLPQSVGPYYGEASTTLTGEFIRIGNFDRAWSSPTHL